MLFCPASGGAVALTEQNLIHSSRFLAVKAPNRARTAAGFTVGNVAGARAVEPDEGSMKDNLRLALRRLWQQPGFSLVVVATLALGLGANTAVFTLINALMLRPLPVQQPDQLYRVGDTNDCCVNSGWPRAGFSLFSYRLFEQLRSSLPEFVDLAGFQANLMPASLRRSGSSTSQSVNGQFVTANYFRMFGVNAVAGRGLQPDDDQPGAAPVVVISYRAWSRLDFDPSVVGGSLMVNGMPMTVAGVAPAEFFGDAIRPDPADVWLPMGQEPALRAAGSLIERADSNWLYAIGRLRRDARPEQVSARATAALQQWLSAQSFIPETSRDLIARQYIVVTPASGGIPLMAGQYSRSLTLLLMTSAVLLLIAAANLANMLLARADRGQAAIRAALGASAWRLIRQSMVEGLVLALIGAAAGVIIATWGANALVEIAFPGVQFMPLDITPSLPVLAFACALAIVTAALFTGAPAWLMARAAPLDALSATGRGSQARSFLPRRSLVITQVALSFAMVTSALLLASSLRNLEQQRLGFDPADRWVVRIDPAPALAANPDQLARYYERLQERLRRVPGVSHVSYALYSPMEGNNWSSGISIGGRASDPARPDGSSWNRVGPRYFETVGTRALRGRLLDERDVANARHVAVVNEAFTRLFFPDTEPMGRTLGIGDASHAGDYEIVGVVDDVKYTAASDPTVRPMIFLPAFQTIAYADASAVNTQARSMLLRAVVVQVGAGTTNVEAALRQALGELDPNLNILRVLPMTTQVSGNFRIERLMARATTTYGLLALLLASLGLYGVTSYGVRQRTREIGVRMALGAGREKILRTIVRGPFVDTLAGLALGVPLTVMAGRALSTQLYGLDADSPRVIAMAIALLLVTAAAAAAIPARRATAIDPAQALRGE
jgi:predicted permease